MKITRRKSPYQKLEAEDSDTDWYVIAPTKDEAWEIADRIGMPEPRQFSTVYLTDEQYNAIPEAD